MAGLRARLATELRVPVEMASPLEYLKVAKTGLTDEQLTSAAAVLAAPVGLAMAPLASSSTKLTSLFPSEHTKEGAERRAKVLTAVAVGGLAVLLGGAYMARQTQVSSARDDARTATAQAVALERQVQKLKSFEDAEILIKTQQAQVDVALASDVDIPVFMDRLVGQMPADVSWTSFSMALTPPSSAPGVPAAASSSMGTVTVSGTGLSHDSAAHWITKMRELKILSNLWVPSSTKLEGSPGGAGGETFSSTANITATAKSDRAAKYKVSAL
jgi:Tfp pilus assembly protein PilN